MYLTIFTSGLSCKIFSLKRKLDLQNLSFITKSIYRRVPVFIQEQKSEKRIFPGKFILDTQQIPVCYACILFSQCKKNPYSRHLQSKMYVVQQWSTKWLWEPLKCKVFSIVGLHIIIITIIIILVTSSIGTSWLGDQMQPNEHQ